MLSDSKMIGFIATTDYAKARAFYEGQLGLRFVSQDQFALVLESNGNMIRIPKAKDVKPHAFTVLGWEVASIEDKVSQLQEKGVAFEKYGIPGQDERGIWTAPGGDKVAWFKDPDGNVLSISQHH